MSELIKNVRAETDRIIMVYSNSGKEWDYTNDKWHDGKEHGNSEIVPRLSVEWRKLGATIIGGCCRINPEHITEMKAIHDKITAK